MNEDVNMRNLIATGSIIAALVLAPAVGLAAKKGEKAFLKEAMQGNMTEIEFGKLAMEKATNQDVKAYGQMLVDDHSQANQKAQTLAQQLGVQAPADIGTKHQAELKKFQSMTGATFDRMFVEHMVKDHKKDVKDYQAQAGSGPVAGFAKETLPTLQKHLDKAQSLMSKVSSGKAPS